MFVILLVWTLNVVSGLDGKWDRKICLTRFHRSFIFNSTNRKLHMTQIKECAIWVAIYIYIYSGFFCNLKYPPYWKTSYEIFLRSNSPKNVIFCCNLWVFLVIILNFILIITEPLIRSHGTSCTCHWTSLYWITQPHLFLVTKTSPLLITQPCLLLVTKPITFLITEPLLLYLIPY